MAGQLLTPSNGEYYIKKHGNFFLEPNSANNVMQRSLPATESKWEFTRNTDDGSYRVKSIHNGLSLGVEGNSADDLKRIQTQAWSSSNNAQRWYVYDTGNGTIEIVNKGTGKTITNDGTGDGVDTHTMIQWGRRDYIYFELQAAGSVNYSDDVIATLHFDNSGRTVSSSSKTVGGMDIGASVAQYTPSRPNTTGTDIKKLNRVTASAGFGRNIQNLAVNGSAERDGNWTKLAWQDMAENNFTFARASDQKYNGTSSFKLSTSAVYGTSSGARVYQNLPLTLVKPGKTYTASAYVKTENVVRSSSLNGGACITVQPLGGTGTNTTIYSECLTGTTDTQIDNGWHRLMVTFTLPAGGDYTSTRLNLLLRNATGTVWYDNIQVEEGPVASVYNYLENNCFETGIGTNPSQWTGGNMAAGDGVSTADKKDGVNSYKIAGDPTVNKYVFQIVPVSGDKKDTYIVSGWAKAASVATDDNKKFNILIKIGYSDGYVKEGKAVAYFNHSVKDWQYTCTPFNLDDGTTINRAPVSIYVILRYEQNCNTAYFDNIQLIKDAVPTYDYNDKGELINIVDNAQKKSTLEYNGKNDLIRSIDAKGYDFSYIYDPKHNMMQAGSQNNVNYNFSYNSRGVATSFEVRSVNTSNTIQSDLTLNTGIHAGAYITSERDQRGKQTDLTYEAKLGLLTSTTGPDGVTTTNTYNPINDLLTSTTKNNITNSYGYNAKKQLTSVSHNGFDYTFSYDVYGNPLQTKAGSAILATNEYKANNGVLKKMTYGNGDSISYDLDSLDRVSKQRFNDSVRYEWLYDASGQATVHKDLYNQLQYESTLDSLGRFARSNVIDTSKPNGSERTLFSAEVGYDVMNNVNRLAYKAGGRSVTSAYTYGKDNLPTTHAMTGAACKQEYAYDALNRLTGYTIGTDVPVNVSYTYSGSDRKSLMPSNGQYYIKKSGAFFLEPNSVNVIQRSSSTLDSIWQFTRNSDDGTYRIMNINNGLSLGVDGNSVNDLVRIQTQVWSSTNNAQRWYLYGKGDGTIEIVNKGSGKTLAGEGADGNNSIIVQWGRRDYIYFELQPAAQEPALYNGDYYIKKSGGFFLEPSSVNVIQRSSSTVDSIWRFTRNTDDGTYRIKNINNGLSLGVDGNSVNDLVRIQTQVWSSTNNAQRWYLYDKGNGTIEIVNKASGKTLAGEGADGNNSVIVQWGRRDYIYFELQPAEQMTAAPYNGDYYIKKNRDFFLEPDSVNTIQRASSSLNSIWQFTRNTDDGTYRIKNINNGLSLGVDGNSANDLVRIQTQVWSSTNNAQRWYLYDKGNGTIEIVNKASGKTLAGEGADGNNSILVQWGRRDSIYFELQPVAQADREDLCTTTQIRTETIGSTAYRSDYDDMGRISALYENDIKKADYAYDKLGQLIRENNLYINKTVVYNYDGGGNLTSRVEYPYTTSVALGTPTKTYSYSYGDSNWKDKMTGFDGQTITYDAIGNPLSYRGYTLAWEGRQLKSLSGNGTTASYRYNASGLRVSKTVNTVRSDFHYVNGKLMHEKRGELDIYYTYGPNGNLSSISYTPPGAGETRYYTVCNWRGDVVALYGQAGELKAKYIYDTWGKVIDILDGNGTAVSSASQPYHPGVVNPIRYRGYYYDSETGLYYLKSRYYDPATSRFMNADGLVSTGQGVLSYNMFVYCLNNPVNYKDPTGKSALLSAAIAIAIVAVAAVAIAAAKGIKDGFCDFFTGQKNAVKSFLNNPIGTYKSFYTNPANIVKFFPVVDYWISTGKNIASGVETLASGDPYAIGYRTGQNAGEAIEVLVLMGVTGGASRVISERQYISALKNTHPPGWNNTWKWEHGTRGTRPRWFDPNGGEWRLHVVDKHHINNHWDYNPWDHACSEWKNIPFGGD